MAHRKKHRAAEQRSRQFALNMDRHWNAVEDAALETPVAEPRVPTDYEESILLGLQQKSHVYQGPDAGPTGTGRRLTEQKIADRRIRNRAAKRSRKANRGNAAAVAWLMIFSALFGSALYFSAPSDASTNAAPIIVTAEWIGGDCYGRTATHPADADPWTLSSAFVAGCASKATEFQNVRRGQFFGVNPDIGDAFAVSCTVKNAVSGVIVATDYATKNNGHDANCLGRWTA